MMPYIVTIAVLAISMIAKISANKKRESSCMWEADDEER